ncbi:MAG: GntR family transcriptional regulator [Victivallaceae bacterium]|nr:GntR family transcriptional regulator [Victivallaceae bacterium]
MLSTITVEPLYEKVKKQLLAYIESEKPKVLPREKDLIRLFGVSRNTVRHAVQDLSNAGVLNPIQGRGTVVLKYAEDKIADIGVICTDSLDITELWVATMLKTLRQSAHTEGYHLNLFFCHDYSINPSNNSAYSYLINSGKLAGLILMSALKYEDITYIRNTGLPFVTVDFRYRDFEHPALLPDCMESIVAFIDKYSSNGLKQFGIIAKSTDVLQETKCFGQNDLIIENWETLLRRKNLPVIPYDFSLDIAEQVRKMYALPAMKRPQVVFTPFIAYGQEVKTILAVFSDWKPIHITTEMKGYETGIPAIVVDQAMYTRKAMAVLHEMITDSQTVEAVKYQTAPVYEHKHAQLASVAG